MSIKHTNPITHRFDSKNRTNQRAVAPYNFVPLPERVVPARQPMGHDRYDTVEGVTGRIDCTITTQSPTYIRGLFKDELYRVVSEGGELVSDKEKMASFFGLQTDDGKVIVPRIPGSSLRGLVRSIVEIISYSRIRNVNKSPTFTFRAVAAAKDDPLRFPYEDVIGRFGANVNAGILVRDKRSGDWMIQPVERPSRRDAYLKVKEREIPNNAVPGFKPLNHPDYKPGYFKISFRRETRQGKRGSYTAITAMGTREANLGENGFLVCSGNMLETANTGQRSPRKNHAIVIDKPAMDDRTGQKISPLRIPKQAIDDYCAGLSAWQKEELRGKADGVLVEGAPVFYVREGNSQDVFYFGHSPNFRIPARLQVRGGIGAANPADFVPPHVSDDYTQNRDIVYDMVDTIFGWVRDDEAFGEDRKQRRGHVAFSDAICQTTENVWYTQDQTPITPKTLASPKPTTFQHYLVQDKERGHHPDSKAHLAHYGVPPSNTSIRGHKQYWHKGKRPEIEHDGEMNRDGTYKHESQLTRISPINPDVQFTCSIQFENLHEEEVGALLWALSLPSNDEAIYYHKIGMGKPLGMGAIQIEPQLMISNRVDRYSSLFASESEWSQGETVTESNSYIEAFERYILEDNGIGGTELRLSEVERIQALLTMLTWREGTEEWLDKTRYMEINHGSRDINEYKERPVLPDPSGVVAMEGKAHDTRGIRSNSPNLPDPKRHTAPQNRQQNRNRQDDRNLPPERPKPAPARPRPQRELPDLPSVRDNPDELAKRLAGKVSTDHEPDKTYSGAVVQFIKGKKSGFIQVDETGERISFRIRNVDSVSRSKLQRGDLVTFKLKRSMGGKSEAHNITLNLD